MAEDFDRTKAIVTLQRLEAQVRNAIQYLKSDQPLIEDPRVQKSQGTRSTFEIGDFIVTDRFIEPH